MARSPCKYDAAALRQWALLQTDLGVALAIPGREMLAILDDLERFQFTLERIVGWDYPCRDDNCGAGDVAAKAFEED